MGVPPPSMGAGGEPPQVGVVPNIQFSQPTQQDTVTCSQSALQNTGPEYKTNIADVNVTQSPSLSNGTPVTSEVTKSSNEVAGKSMSDPSNIEKTQATSDSVTVSVKTSPYVERTNVSEEDTSDTNSGKEKTPEVNIVPPTPVEKEPEVEIPTKSVEPTTEVVSGRFKVYFNLSVNQDCWFSGILS